MPDAPVREKKINSEMAIVTMAYPQKHVSAAKQTPQMHCGFSPGAAQCDECYARHVSDKEKAVSHA